MNKSSGLITATKDNTHYFFILLCILLGVFVRLIHVVESDFPLNDGGLFYVMSGELIENDYRLPEFSSYNSLNMPFAYPPLPLYLSALLVDLGGIEGLSVIKYLPALISVLSIPIFYLFSRDFTNSNTQSIYATVAFAFVPRSFIWLIMGGGLTRGSGLPVLFVGSMANIFLMYKHSDKKHTILAILFCSLTVLSHPEAAFFVLSSAVVFFLFLERNWQGVKRSIFVSLGVALFTSPWWITIMVRYGLSPLISSGASTAASIWSRIVWPLIAILTFDLTEEVWVKLFAVLGLIGLFWCISKKQFLLPTWLLLMVVLNTRGHLSYAMVPLCLMAGMGTELVLNALSSFGDKTIRNENAGRNWFDFVMQSTATKIAFGFLLIHGLASAYVYPFVPSNDSSALPILGSGERRAMAWISENTNEASTFISISTQPWWLDPISEWFPALANRINLNTVQGTEWLPDGEFHDRWRAYDELQKCSYRESDCLSSWVMQTNKNFTHVYVKKIDKTSALRNSLGDSPDYLLIYENFQVVVYQHLSTSVGVLAGKILDNN